MWCKRVWRSIAVSVQLSSSLRWTNISGHTDMLVSMHQSNLAAFESFLVCFTLLIQFNLDTYYFDDIIIVWQDYRRCRLHNISTHHCLTTVLLIYSTWDHACAVWFIFFLPICLLSLPPRATFAVLEGGSQLPPAFPHSSVCLFVYLWVDRRREGDMEGRNWWGAPMGSRMWCGVGGWGLGGSLL